jgi:hypothetical protein
MLTKELGRVDPVDENATISQDMVDRILEVVDKNLRDD